MASCRPTRPTPYSTLPHELLAFGEGASRVRRSEAHRLASRPHCGLPQDPEKRRVGGLSILVSRFRGSWPCRPSENRQEDRASAPGFMMVLPSRSPSSQRSQRESATPLYDSVQGSAQPARQCRLARPFPGVAPTTNSVALLVNSVSVTPSFAGLSGAGLCQLNLTVPPGLARAMFRFRQAWAACRRLRPLSSPCRSRGLVAFQKKVSLPFRDAPQSPGMRQVKGLPSDFEQAGNVLPPFPGVDRFAGVFDLLRRQFGLAPKFHASALRGLHSGAGPFADQGSEADSLRRSRAAPHPNPTASPCGTPPASRPPPCPNCAWKCARSLRRPTASKARH